MKIGYVEQNQDSSYEVTQKYIEEKRNDTNHAVNQLLPNEPSEDMEFEQVEYQTISEAIGALVDEQIDEAILPIESALQGGNAETIDNLIENDGIYVNGELFSEDENQTKFWIISKDKDMESKFPEEIDKMSLIFSTKDEPGALYEILGIFNFNKINLTKIESRPAKTTLGEYIFWVDLIANENIDTVLRLLEEECTYLKVLGRY